MAKLRVGTGWGKTDLTTALQRATPGDTVELDPGHYRIGFVNLYGILLRGSGAPGEVVLEGKLRAHGQCGLANLELRSEPYNNALSLESPEESVHVTDCVIVGDPAAKFPAVWAGGGSVVLERATMRHEPGTMAINLLKGATLHATGSRLGRLLVQAATADLISCLVTFIDASEAARVSSYGSLAVEPQPGDRILVATGRSVCRLPQLALTSGYQEAYADDSMIEIGQVEQPGGIDLTVQAANGAAVRSTQPEVVIQDLDAPDPEPEPSPEPAVREPAFVTWPIEHANANAFVEHVAPELYPGDTLLLGEGEYHLDDLFTWGVNVAGRGSAHRTVIHGGLSIAEGRSVEIANVTIRPGAEGNAIQVLADAEVTLRGVILDADEAATFPALFASAGVVKLSDCAIGASANLHAGGAVIEGTAVLDAASSTVARLVAQKGGQAKLASCSGQTLLAEGATIVTVGQLSVAPNDQSLLSIYAADDAVIDIDQLSAEGAMPVRADSARLRIGEFSSAVNERIQLEKAGIVDLDLPAGSFDVFEYDEDGQLVSEPETAHAGSAAGAHAPAGGSEPAPPGAADAVEDPAPAVDIDHPLAELHALIGLETIKKQVQGFINAVNLRRMRAEAGLPADKDFSLHSMFLGNPGTGKTTVARLVGKALHEAGVMESELFVEVLRTDLISDNIGASAQLMRQRLEEGAGGVILIDEAYALAKQDSAGFADEAITELLVFMENHRNDTMVILAGYPDKMQDLLNVNEGMRSRIKHRFDFEDYSPAEIASVGLSQLHEGRYTVNEELYRRVVTAAYSQSADRSNARWVRNFNQDLRAKLDERVILLPNPTVDDLTRIDDADLHALAGGDPTERRSKLDRLLAELDEMIGLDSVKAWVHELVVIAEDNQASLEEDGSMERPNYHMAFTGGPGTGKTTVARIIAGIFHALGVLHTPNVTVTDPSTMRGRYLGVSSENVTRAFDEAMGGVLFVDEAHQMRQRERDNVLNDEMVSTMITRLENDRDRFVAIFAGYTDEMDAFFQSDPGLRRRIPTIIEFPDYTSEEVAQIVARVLSGSRTFNEELLRSVTVAAYDATPAGERSNGGWARNFAEAIIKKHAAYRVQHAVRGEARREVPDEVIEAFRPA